MCYPVCVMVHIKEPLLLIGKSSPCVAAGFLSLWEQDCSSKVERSPMVRWVIGSILHGVDPLSYMHIKEPLLLIRVAYVAAAGFLSHYQNGP